jgi:protein-tyrosine phosphatase
MRLPLNNLVNCRDMGGIPLPSKNYTKYKRFVRSDGFKYKPGEVNDFSFDLNYLKEYGVQVILDLRGNSEVTTYPDPLNNSNFTYYNVNLCDNFDVAEAGRVIKDISDYYLFVIDSSGKNIKKVIDIICLHPNDCILFHCYAGKDRTGLLGYFLLSIIEADLYDIIADYSQTDTYIKKFLDSNKLKGTKKQINANWNAKKENMFKVDNYIKKNYGSPLEYLKKQGVTEEQFDTIKKMFLE